MTWMSRVLLTAAFLIAVPVASAQHPDTDWQACAQDTDRGRQIRGCTAVLGRSTRESATNRAIALSNRGNAQRARGNLDAAMADYSEAIRLDPRLAVALRNRGNAHRARGNLDAAMVDYNEAIRLDPRHVNAFIDRGDAHRARGSLDAAMADFSEAIRLDPRHVDAFVARGNAHHDHGNLDAGMADYNEAIRLDPRSALAILSRGLAHHDHGNLDAAMADYNEAIRLDPHQVDAFVARGDAHQDRGNLDAAIADYNEAIRLNPRFAFAYDSRGTAHRARGNLDAAMADFNEAISLNPQQSRFFNSRTYVHLARGDHNAALTDINAAIEMDSLNANLFDTRGDVYRARGDFQSAITDYTQSIRLDPSFAVAYNNRGLSHRDRGDLEAALSDLRMAVELGRDEAQHDLAQVEARLSAHAAFQFSAQSTATRPVAQQDTAPTQQERRVALVIGNAAYRGAGVAPLPNPPRDGRAMADLFRDLGFQHVALHQDLDQAGMLRALRDFEREAERADWAVVYFAGHGIEINGANHLVPVDAQLRSDRDVPDEAVPLNRVLARLEGARKLRLVILDASRDNPFVARMQRVATSTVTRGLAPVDDAQMPVGTLVAFAALAGQLAEDGSGENSPFVQALSRRMREPGVDVNLMFRHVRDDVLAATGRRQEPFTYSSLPGEVLFLRPR